MTETTRFVLVTGCSGAGKSQALRVFEDLGYYCVDNLPAQLVPTLAGLAVGGNRGRRRFAVCVDARSGENLERLPAYLDEVSELGVRPDCLFLDCSDAVLVQRYSETRRRHPMAPDGNIEQAIERERTLLDPIRGRADLLLDTSAMSISELRERISGMFSPERTGQRMVVSVLSFGFKYGLPPEADLVLDVRFLPNPHYDAELRPWSGNEPDVRDYVLNNQVAQEFLERGQSFLKFLLPHYAAESKSYLTIAIGCTGGKHRSVAVAHDLAMYVRTLKYPVRLRHRDVGRSP